MQSSDAFLKISYAVYDCKITAKFLLDTLTRWLPERVNDCTCNRNFLEDLFGHALVLIAYESRTATSNGNSDHELMAT